MLSLAGHSFFTDLSVFFFFLLFAAANNTSAKKADSGNKNHFGLECSGIF
jgi:hypothetical protein